MDKFVDLHRNIYLNDPYFIKLKEVFEKWKNFIGHKKIALNEKKLLQLSLQDNFVKLPNMIFECLLLIDFTSKECFKVYMTIYRALLKKNSFSLDCPKAYVYKICKVNRWLFDRVVEELVEKNMLIVSEGEESKFSFILNLAPLSWNLDDEVKEKISLEVNREIRRLQSRWINEDPYFVEEE